MRIARAHLTRVRYPLGGAKVTAHDVVSEHHKTIVRLQSECGAEGIGECSGKPDIFPLACGVAKDQIGQDPRDVVGMRRRFSQGIFHQRNGRNGWIAYGAIELACWDLVARRHELPLHALLGGARRHKIAVALGLGAVPLADGASRADAEAFMDDPANVDRVIENAQARVAPHGYGTIKIKSAAYRPDWDLRVLSALRETFGRAMKIRVDPNAGYSPAQAMRLFPRLDPLGLEYFEDPTSDLEGMARLRRQVRTPIATNMCCIQFDQLAPAIRLGAVDIVLGDVFHWGGVAAARELTAVLRAFGLGFGVHSLLEGEWDVGIAANLQLAAALGDGEQAIAGTFPSPAGTILEGAPLAIEGGEVAIPDGPGLGVRLDEARIAALAVEDVIHET